MLWQIRKEEKRLAAGWTYEPPTFYERNEAAADRPDVPLCRSAKPLAVSTPAKPLVHAPFRKAGDDQGVKRRKIVYKEAGTVIAIVPALFFVRFSIATETHRLRNHVPGNLRGRGPGVNRV